MEILQRFFHNLVNRAGFEPATHSLEGCCSIQLSYQSPNSDAKLV